jgi:hypothetical protein
VATFEIFLSKNDLEHIANGHDIKIKISHGRGSRINGVILKHALANDTMNPLINHKYKLIDTERKDLANSFTGGAR